MFNTKNNYYLTLLCFHRYSGDVFYPVHFGSLWYCAEEAECFESTNAVHVSLSTSSKVLQQSFKQECCKLVNLELACL